jgi:Phage portal protein
MPTTLRERLAWLLGLEAKASRTAKLIAWAAGGQPVWTPRDFASLAREGFAKNAVVYRSVRMIAEAAASVPLFLFDGESEVDEHKLLTLLAKPNPAHCAPDLFEAWYGHLLVAGNAYLEAVSVNGALRELHVLRPDRMKVVPGANGWPEAYDYTVGGQTVRFRQDASEEYSDHLQSYIDAPKTLDELQSAVSSPTPGSQIHHIVEQGPAAAEGFPRSTIDDPENLVRIPTFKHEEISGWFAKPNKDFGGMSPRDYLRGKDWSDRTSVGVQALIKFEVLKP